MCYCASSILYFNINSFILNGKHNYEYGGECPLFFDYKIVMVKIEFSRNKLLPLVVQWRGKRESKEFRFHIIGRYIGK